MSSDGEILDGAVPLVRNDEPWQWWANFWEDTDETTPTDLTGKTVSAEIRWSFGAQPVTTEVVDATGGQVRLSLLAAQTAAMPLGRLSKLYIALDADTEVVVPVDVLEGLFPRGVPVDPPVPEPSLPVHVVTPASGAIVVLTDLRPVYVETGPLASLFIRLPLGATAGASVEINFAADIAALEMQAGSGAAVAGGPTNAAGGGAAIVMQYVDDTRQWKYWK